MTLNVKNLKSNNSRQTKRLGNGCRGIRCCVNGEERWLIPPSVKCVGGSRQRAKCRRWSVGEEGQIPGVGSHQEWLEKRQHLDSTERGLGDQADVMSPSPGREAGPCTHLSFSKWMEGMSRSKASPGHFGSSSGMTLVSPLHPFHTAGFQPAGSEWCPKLGTANNTHSSSASGPHTRLLNPLP